MTTGRSDKMKKVILTAVCVILLSGCSLQNELSDPSTFTDDSGASAVEAVKPAYSEEELKELLDKGFIPKAEQDSRVEGKRLSFTFGDIYSQGENYSMSISGVEWENQNEQPSLETTTINGVLYGDFRLDLYKNSFRIQSLKINIPRDDRFLILESAAENLSYGCEILSNHTEFGSDDYPDILQLDFYNNSDGETPQYARFFAVFNDELVELPVYENGEPCPPYGTHLTMKEPGLMIQHLTVSSGSQYRIVKYEYTFDVENKRLDKKEVRFYGWEDQ